MRAHQLAKLLLKMPNIEVGYAHTDNGQYEIAGECQRVDLLIKADVDTSGLSGDELHSYNLLPVRAVVIRG